jgi:transposase
MTRKRDLTLEERLAIVTLRQHGVFVVEVAKEFGVAPSTVTYTCQRYEEGYRLTNRPGRGRKRKTTPRDDRALVRSITSGHYQTPRQVAESACLHSGVDVNPQTVRNRMHEAGYVARVKTKRPLLTKRHRKLRVEWAREHASWTTKDWDRVLFSDESKFKVFGSDGRQWTYRRPGSRLNRQDVRPVVKYGVARLWCGGASPPRVLAT